MLKTKKFFLCFIIMFFCSELWGNWTKQDVVNNAQRHFTSMPTWDGWSFRKSTKMQVAALLYVATRDERYANFVFNCFRQMKRAGYAVGEDHFFEYGCLARHIANYLVCRDFPAQPAFTEAQRREVEEYIYRVYRTGHDHGSYNQHFISCFCTMAAVALRSRYGNMWADELLNIARSRTDINANWGAGFYKGYDDSIGGYEEEWFDNVLPMYHWYFREWANQKCKFSPDKTALQKWFEWSLQTVDSLGRAPNIGHCHRDNRVIKPLIMVMASQIAQDGRYKWLAERCFESSLYRKHPCTYYEWFYTDDGISPVKPLAKSIYFKGGDGYFYEEEKPQKIIFRDSWDRDGMFVMLDLRGRFYWHDDWDIGEVSTIVSGENFLALGAYGQGTNPNSDWDTCGWYRLWHNCFLVSPKVGETPQYENFYHRKINVRGCFCDVGHFAELLEADFAQMIVPSGERLYHGFKTKRNCIFIPFLGLVVFDYAECREGDGPRTVGPAWHFRGNPSVSEGKIRLQRGNYALNVYYPMVIPNQFIVETPTGTEQGYLELFRIAGGGGEPSLHLYLTQSKHFQVGEGVGMTTVFCPLRSGEPVVTAIEVKKEDESPAYPIALGVKIESERKKIIGTRFKPGTYFYHQLKTDAESFVYDDTEEIKALSYVSAEKFEIPLSYQPEAIKMVSFEERDNQYQIRYHYLSSDHWRYENGEVKITLPPEFREQGELKIYRLDLDKKIEEGILKKKSNVLAYPNPFNPECYIPAGRMESEGERIEVKIYNILGQLVREIECSMVQGAKNSMIYWDGRDNRGLEVPSGVYFYEVAGEAVRRMVVLR